MFPYNLNDERDCLGAPLNFDDAFKLAETLLYWHHENHPENWSQSGAQIHPDTLVIALGLMVLFADPSHMKILQMLGSQTKDTIQTIMDVHEYHEKTDVHTYIDRIYDLMVEIGVLKIDKVTLSKENIDKND